MSGAPALHGSWWDPPGATGPALVLVHGAGGDHLGTWPAAIRQLPGRRVLAIDLPGHGGTPGPARPTIAALAGAVADEIERRALGRALVVGHSMGGAVALWLALEHPGVVAGIALVASGARLRVAPAVLQATEGEGPAGPVAAAVAAQSFGPAAPEPLRRAYARGLAATPRPVLHADFVACDAFDVMARVEQVAVPTLVACGTEDQLTPPRYAQYLAARIPGARLVTVPGAGHAVMLEAPDAIAAALEALVRDVAAAR